MSFLFFLVFLIVSFWIPAKVGAIVGAALLVCVLIYFISNLKRHKVVWSAVFTMTVLVAFIIWMLS